MVKYVLPVIFYGCLGGVVLSMTFFVITQDSLFGVIMDGAAALALATFVAMLVVALRNKQKNNNSN